MNIQVIDGEFAVCRANSFSSIDFSKEYIFMANTDEEKSLVCPLNEVPDSVSAADKGWRAFRVCGELDFSLIGILSDISGILAENKIGIFVVSTYNTDYIFTKSENFSRALDALANHGYTVV